MSLMGDELSGSWFDDVPVVASFEVPGHMRPKARPRLAKGRIFTPRETLDCEALVGSCFMRAARGYVVDRGKRYRVDVVFYAAGKADIDNLLKTVLDGLNGLAWADDAHVDEVRARRERVKRAEERTLVTICEL